MRVFCLCVCALVLLVAGCSTRSSTNSTSGPARDPIARVLTWFSYLNGDDLRRACAAGATDRYRLVYNAVWTEQVRTYEIITERPLPGTQGAGVPPAARQISRAFSPAPLVNAYLDAISGRQPVATSQVPMSSEMFTRFHTHLADSGFYQPAPVGAWLRSDRFYWVAMGCTSGAFHYNAWAIPLDGTVDLRFIPDLVAFDRTGARFPEPRSLPATPYHQPAGLHRKQEIAFRVQIAKNGLVGQRSTP